MTGLAVLDPVDREGATIVAGTSDGRIVLISESGEVIGAQKVGSGIAAMASMDSGGGSALIVGLCDGRLRALRPD